MLKEKVMEMKKCLILLMGFALLCSGCAGKTEDTDKDNPAAEPAPETMASETEMSVVQTEDVNEDTVENNPVQTAVEENIDTASTKEEDELQEEEDLTGRDLFADYIMGKRAAVVSKDFVSAINMTEITLNPGDEYTVSELEDLLRNDSLIGDTQPKVSYAPLSIHDGALFAMQLYYESDRENLTETMIFSDHTGKLEMIFAIDSWSRRYASLNKEGVVFDDGSNGAGSHSSVIYAPDTSFIYRKISDLDEEYYGFGFYDEEGNPSATVNDIMTEAGEGNEKAKDVIYYREIIDGKRYYYFLRGMEKLTQDTVEYIDKIAKDHDFTFDGKSAADEARSAYEKQMGVEEACQDREEPYWKSL